MKQRAIWIYLLFSILFASFVPFSFAQDDLSCSILGTSEVVETTFLNDLDFDITFHWVDFECDESPDGNPLASGATTSATTYDGHEFILRDGEGVLIGYYVVSVADAGGEVAFSNYLGQFPAWLNSTIIESEPEIIEEEIEEEPDFETIITLVPIDESVLPTADCSADNGEEITNVSFWNDTGTDMEIYLYWLNWDCVTEEELYVYPDDHYYEFYSTFVGHDFVFRNADGELLARYKISAEDTDQWYPLSEIITVETTVVEREAIDFNDYIETAVNPNRIEAGLAPVTVSPVLQQIAEIIASEFTPSDETFLEAFGNASAYEATNLYTAAASEFGYEGNTSPVVIHGEGLTNADIRTVLDVTLDYEGWYNEEISSYAVLQVGDVFVILASDAVETEASAEDDEEWATFEYEDEATTESAVTNIVGTFNHTDDITYTFSAQAGELYAILYSAEEYDPYLYLDDANGQNLLANDDSFETLNSFIVFRPDESGDYTLRLDTYQTEATGEYTLEITQPDARISGAVLAGETPTHIPFDVVAGTRYIIDASSDEFDTTLTVLNGGIVIINNDDRGDGTTNSFVTFLAPTTGTYSIVVDSFNGQSTGQYVVLTGSFK